MRDVKETWDYLVSQLCEISERGPDRPAYYRRLRDLLGRNSKLVLYDDSPNQGINLVHYTTWKSALEMFDGGKESDEDQESPSLRMYHYEYSNDPEEGKIKPPEWKKIEKNARSQWIDRVLKDRNNWMEEWGTYGCSFSSGPTGVEDDLTYWRLYGNDGQGCSLKISSRNERIYRVRYRDKDFNKRKKKDREEDKDVAKRLHDIFDIGSQIVNGAPREHKPNVEITVAEGLLRIIYGYYHLIKHINYEEEKEWRMIEVMPKPDIIRYDTMSENIIKRYIEGPPLDQLLITGSVITIGPTVPNRGAARAYLEHLAKEKHKIRPVNVKNSNQTYRQV